MDPHVTEELTALLDGELSELERERVERHLRECAGCCAERDRLHAVLGSLAQVAAAEPSLELRRKVLRAVDAEPKGLRARFRALLSVRFLFPATTAACAAAAFAIWIHSSGKVPAAAVDLEVAERLELFQDYDVVASALPMDVSASDMDVVAHLHELGE